MRLGTQLIRRLWPRILTLTVAWGSSAHAEGEGSKAEQAATCAASFEQSQVLRKNSQLRAARAELLKCAQLQCREAIRNQCSAWLEDAEKATPSLIIEATIDGEERTDLQVAVDGTPAEEWSPTKALEIDPGEHLLRVTAPNFPPAEKRIIMREGDKRRVFSFSFGAAKPPVTVAPPAPSPERAPPPVAMHRPVPAITYVLAGTALVGGGVFAALASKAKQQEKQLRTDCSPSCTDDQVDDLKSRYLMANVALGVGGAAAVGALITFLVRPSVPVHESPVQGGLLITPRSASASALVRF